MGLPRIRILVLAMTMAIGLAIDAHASDTDLPFTHIRSTDPRLRVLLDDATATSATVRALVERITASDVVVYVACETDPRVRSPGRLNFMSTAGGLRYVMIRLKLKRREAAIAALAHELQHAAEIADSPSVVDEASLAREYERIGFRSHSSRGELTFDTQAAVETGRRVREEIAALKTSAAD